MKWIICAVMLSCSFSVRAEVSGVFPNGCGTVVDLPWGGQVDATRLVPDNWFGINLRGACDSHDLCYHSRSSKRDCDDRFLSDLLQSCRGGVKFLGIDFRDLERKSCRRVAHTYYRSVRHLGYPAYERAQARVRDMRTIAELN